MIPARPQAPRLWYVAQPHAQFPSSYANNFQVMKMCAGFATCGIGTTLLVTPTASGDRRDVAEVDLRRFFGVTREFAIERLAFGYPYRRFRRSVHAVAVARYLRRQPCWLAYTRSEWAALTLTVAGLPTVLELHHLSRGPAQWQAFRLARHAASLIAVIVVSESLRRAVVDRGVPPEKTLVAHDGVDFDLFEPPIDPVTARRRLGWPVDVPTVVHLGSLYRGRGIETVMEAARRLPAVRFVFIGGPADDADRHRREAEEAGILNVAFPGLVPNAEVPLCLFAADALVMSYTDGTPTREYMSPMKMFEYMAAGRPIVTSDYPVLREVLTPEMAVFVPPGDAGALADAVGGLLAEPARSVRLSAAARRAAAGFDWSVRARRILDFLAARGLPQAAVGTVSA